MKNGRFFSERVFSLSKKEFFSTPFVGNDSIPNMASSESTQASSRGEMGSVGGFAPSSGFVGTGWMRNGTPRINTMARILFSVGSKIPCGSRCRFHQPFSSNAFRNGFAMESSYSSRVISAFNGMVRPRI